jgi:hypothetical protein
MHVTGKWPVELDEFATIACDLLNSTAGFQYTDPKTGVARAIVLDDLRAFFNWYRNGADSVAFHADKDVLSEKPTKGRAARPERPVVSFTAGALREFLVRCRATKALKYVVRPPHGSVLIMLAGMQRTHDHSIRRMAKSAILSTGPRGNLTFRPK